MRNYYRFSGKLQVMSLLLALIWIICPDLHAKANVVKLIATNDDAVEILYFGDWEKTTHTSFFQNDAHRTNIQYHNCVFTFNKSVIRWIGSTGPDHGIADVYIDEVFQKSIDTYSAKRLTKQVLFERKDLSVDRIHTIKIVVR